MKRTGLCALLIGLIVLPASVGVSAEKPSLDAPQLARQLVRAAGISRGLCSVIGCNDSEFVLALARQSRLLIHVLVPDATTMTEMRGKVDQAGLYEDRVIVEKGTAGTLPYADNLVDIVIVPQLTEKKFLQLSTADILRVLRPNGVVLFSGANRGASAGPTAKDLAHWLRASNMGDFVVPKGVSGTCAMVKKPEPDGVDDWSHWQHGPDNNPVSRDTVIKAPYLTQWTGTPYYIAMPAITTAAGGRTFCAMGHIAHHKREEPWLDTIFARDGYNGIELWRRKLPGGYLVHRSAFVATDNVFYMIDEDGNGCRLLDAQTGRDLEEIMIPELSGQWKWMALQDGVLYILAGPTDRKEVRRVRSQRPHWSWQELSRGYYRRQIPWGFGRTIAAYDLAQKKLLWKHDEEGMVDSRAMVIGGGKIFFYGPYSHVGCLYAKTGQVLWTNPNPQLRELVQEQGVGLSSTPGFRTEPFCLYTPEVLCFAPQTNEYVCGVSTKDGRLLWHRRKTTSNPNPIYADGKLLVGIGPGGNTLVLDPLTGKTIKDLGFRKRSCTRLTATPDSFFCRGFPEGTTRYDRRTKKISFNGAMRPSCNDGVVPANGMLYIGPWLCDCNLSLMGAMALCPAGDFHFDHPVSGSDRLEVYVDNIDDVASLKVSSKDWATYRANNDHSASTRVRIPKRSVQSWSFNPQKRFTPVPPTAAGGLVFLCGLDGKVRAIDIQTGRQRWSFLTAGPIRAPATIWNGRAYVGSGDGYVYCLEAATGRPLWRFRAAPIERRIMIYDRLCSAWPVNTGVLVEEGVAYFGAGLIDTDGTYVYAVDAVTGDLKWQNDSSGQLNPEIRKGVSAHGCLTIADGRLYMAGGNVVSPGVYDLKTGECLCKQEVKGPPAANRGQEVAVVNGQYVLQGGRLLFSAFENVVNPGYFNLISIGKGGSVPGLIAGKIPPAWDRRAFVYVNGRYSKIRCCDTKNLRQAAANPRGAEARLEKRWFADAPELRDAVSLALGSNAVVAVCEVQLAGKKTGWAVVAISREDGKLLWKQPLSRRPLSGGLLIDRSGRIVVALDDGRLVCFGKEKGLRLFASKNPEKPGA